MAKDLFDFQLTGGDDLVRTLRKLDATFARNVVRSGMRKSLTPIVRDAKGRAPERTGEAARLLKIYNMKPLPEDLVRLGIGPSKKHFYLMFHEFGTRHISAKPFMRPAWDGRIDAAFKDFVPLMWNVLNKAVGRFAKQAAKGKISKIGARVLR